MSDTFATYKINPDDNVRVPDHPEWGVGEVLRVSQELGVYQAKVLFKNAEGERVENLPVEWLEKAADLWERLASGAFDDPGDYRIKQMAMDMSYANTGGELSASRVDLLPHQILMVHDLVGKSPRRMLIADEVGLGKTIETGMLIRELIARGDAERILIVPPAGLIENWRRELEECFRLHFDVLGRDFQDHSSAAWERHNQVIASIDTLKQQRRLQRLMAAAPWDVVIFDEAHHVSRTRNGKKTVTTQNYRLAEALRTHARDLLFLSATPHQGNAFQFWSLIQILDDQLFASPEAVIHRRSLLNRVMIRRTKREVTDAAGVPIFRRRQVHTERFSLAPRERLFYEQLSEYLREGYNAAGIGQKRTTSMQRAIGFVMATFQKIMSSSPRAIRQALRRRLLVLLVRKQLELESKRRNTRTSVRAAVTAEEIMRIQDEMLTVARAILGEASASTSDAEAYVGRIRRRLQKREEQIEVTEWSLDGDEETEEGVFAASDIPDEIRKVRDLITHAPEGTDRRFETLVRAISDLTRDNLRERFVIFTQYRDTLEFLAKELGRIFGQRFIATIKGGPLEDKIAAMAAFWKEDGARFLICTSAGGEGINLQIGRILFNYDLPWNPMAVEQRIGRVHRYGQLETVQVYNLFAEDTVEERIYDLLDHKLQEIAQSIGKVDEQGQIREDFRSDILGLIGSRPDYQELFKLALVERDYSRTEQDLVKMLDEANRAREALSALSQDFTSFNLENYRRIEGRHTLEELGYWVRNSVLRLGGAAMPEGEFWTFHVPEALQRRYHLAPRYEKVCFDRALSLRSRGSELGGIGHPFVDALLKEVKEPGFTGEVAHLGGDEGTICVRYLVRFDDEHGQSAARVLTLKGTPEGELKVAESIEWTKNGRDIRHNGLHREDIEKLKQRFEEFKKNVILEWIPDRQKRARVTTTLIGIHVE
ncbi:MAG: DEAD/DEAH box helicase [Nitrospirae bacterium]|nr:DEAD/DEAH box helicase [Nitrospirota bacterium]